MLWYTREASVAVYVTNLPGIWPLLRENIRFLRNHTSYADTNGSALPPNTSTAYGPNSKIARSRINATTLGADDEIELGRPSFSKSASRSTHSSDKMPEERLGHFGRKLGDLTYPRRGSLESDERALNESNTEGWGKMNLEVHVDKTIEVHRASWDSNNKGLGMGVAASQAPQVRIEGPEGEVR